MRHNLVALNIFAEVMKVTKHTELWGAVLAWYSLSANHQICFYGLEPSLRIHCFRSTWHWLIVKVVLTQLKFLEPSGYFTGINCTFIFHTTNVFGCFHCEGNVPGHSKRAFARWMCYISRKEGRRRKEGENQKEREKEGRKENEGESEREGTATEREGESARLNTPWNWQPCPLLN